MHRNDRLMLVLIAAMQLATMFWIFSILNDVRKMMVCP